MTPAKSRTDQAFQVAHESFLERFDLWVRAFLLDKKAQALEFDSDLDPLVDCLTEFALRPGKRIRPFLAFCGFQAAGGEDISAINPVCAAAEMLHVFALVHDDVMDQADLRRGLSTVHRMFSDLHDSHGWRGDSSQFGLSSAILVGDLALALSDTLVDSAAITPERKINVRRYWNTMREEVVQGQFLDVLASIRRTPASEQQIWNILSLKSGKYTLERPLHIGAAAAGAPESLFNSFSGYGIPLGRAFQIQDDILGLFGSPDTIGKPNDSDIKEGKSTLLVSYAYNHASASEKEALIQILGNPEASDADVEIVRQIVRDTGSLEYASSVARDLAAEAIRAVDKADIPDRIREILTGLADYVLDRQT